MLGVALPALWHTKALQIILGTIDIGLVIATVVFSIFGTILDWEEFHERAVGMFAWVFPHVSPN